MKGNFLTSCRVSGFYRGNDFEPPKLCKSSVAAHQRSFGEDLKPAIVCPTASAACRLSQRISVIQRSGHHSKPEASLRAKRGPPFLQTSLHALSWLVCVVDVGNRCPSSLSKGRPPSSLGATQHHGINCPPLSSFVQEP